MRILLFSHGSDIDGMGSIIILKSYFEHVDYHFAEISDLDSLIFNEINNGNIYNYDMVFVTDLTPKNETLDYIESDSKLKDKFRVIDHHQTNYDRANNYSFVNIIIEENNKNTCATSLFYDYLVKNRIIEDRDIIKDYAELTRLEDTWTWKNNDFLAHKLAYLFNILGRDKYVDLMVDKLKEDKLKLNEVEELLINNKIDDINSHIKDYLKIKKDIVIDGYKGIIVIIDYQYRNELPEYLSDNNYDYDFATMICFNHNSISFRSITDCNVRLIAEQFGGGGHDRASACLINDKIDKVYELFLKR